MAVSINLQAMRLYRHYSFRFEIMVSKTHPIHSFAICTTDIKASAHTFTPLMHSLTFELVRGYGIQRKHKALQVRHLLVQFFGRV